ncbi:MAG: RNA-binding protein [Elusimicrobia bacterium]|nr:RNA-binding protein [Elusimicrobiota bacterium]
MNIFVGNLSFDATKDDLLEAFGQFGTVASANVINDKMTGRSRGFGFVEMNNDQEAQAAIAGMNGKEIKGRAVTVNEARPKTEGGSRGGFGGGRREGGFGGGRGYSSRY